MVQLFRHFRKIEPTEAEADARECKPCSWKGFSFFESFWACLASRFPTSNNKAITPSWFRKTQNFKLIFRTLGEVAKNRPQKSYNPKTLINNDKSWKTPYFLPFSGGKATYLSLFLLISFWCDLFSIYKRFWNQHKIAGYFS